MNLLRYGLALALVCAPFRVSAVDYKNEYEKNVKASQSVGSLGNDLAGDRVNFYTGGVQFAATDVSLPGNNGLSVALGRTFDVELEHNLAAIDGTALDPIRLVPPQRAFGDWDLDVPYLTGTFANATGWKLDSDKTSPSRCSVIGQFKDSALGTPANGAPPAVTITLPIGQSDEFFPEEYWHGISLHLPGGDQALLVASLPNANRPTDGKTYHWVTNENWWFSCVPEAADTSNEGFLAVAPDGTRYTFNVLKSRPASMLSDTVDYSTDPNGGGPYKTFYLSRSQYYLLPSRVEDRFGNYVTYSWDSAKSYPQLTGISSSDGRQISVTYDPVSGHIGTVFDGTRTWQYQYAAHSATSSDGTVVTTYTLSTVVLPDGSKWQYSFDNLEGLTSVANTSDPVYQNCFTNHNCYGLPTQSLYGASTASVTHPSGAKVDFVFGQHFQADPTGSLWPVGLVSKSVSGPGVVSASWQYKFSPSVDAARTACGAGACPIQIWTDEISPDNSVTRRLFGVAADEKQGRVLGELEGALSTTDSTDTPVNPNGKMADVYDQVTPGSTTAPVFYREADFTFVSATDATNFVYRVGASPVVDGQVYGSERRIPERLRETTLQGVIFTSRVDTTTQCAGYCFDIYGNVTQRTRYSPLGSITDVMTYHHNTVKWVIGEVATVTSGGKQVSRTDYDGDDLPMATYQFGILQQTMGYNTTSPITDRTLAWVKDGALNMTTLSNWKRGIPQLISYPDTRTESAVVNNLGGLDSTTDQLGNTTSYQYDQMGRLKQITPASDAPLVNWNPTIRAFTLVSATEYGVAGGHWKQTVSTGNGRTTTIYDALWRPVVTLTEDTSASASKSYAVTRYDGLGRVVFSSYPVSNLPSASQSGCIAATDAGCFPNWSLAMLGVTTTYDALGRVIRTEQDAEGGQKLATDTSYLDGFKTMVTNPRGDSTITSYKAFDAPTTDMPTSIQSPESVMTTIARDTWGKPTAVTRSGPGG